MSLIVDNNLSAELLTGQMPLSETLTKASSVANKVGINHGLSLEYSVLYSTQYLKINKGSAIVGATLTSGENAQETLKFAVELTEDLTIDLANDLSIQATDEHEYFVALQIDYEAPIVDNDTGLVSSVGKQLAQVLVFEVDNNAFVNTKGLILGKFSRNDGYIEFINEMPYNTGKIDNGTVTNLLNGSVQNENDSLGTKLFLENDNNKNNLRKQICIRDLSSIDIPSLNNEIGVETLAEMPLAGITESITNKNEPSEWLLPINWLTTPGIYDKTHKIWKDVESFKLYDCYIRGDIKLSFHRTPGHNKYYKWIHDDNPEYLIDPDKVKPVLDKGCNSFTFDGKGTIIDGDLDIDLVLDFTGEPYQNFYKVTFKNITVKGNMTVRYGQSILALNGGAIGNIDIDNVHVSGALGLYCWPQVIGKTKNDTVTNTAYTSAYGSSYNSIQYYMNSGQSVLFTGDTGPEVLTYWNTFYTAPASPALNYTKGPLVLAFPHNKVDAVTLTMGDPWLDTAIEGCIKLNNSTLPYNLLGTNASKRPLQDPGEYWLDTYDSYKYVNGDMSDSSDFAIDTRVSIKNCSFDTAGSGIITFGITKPKELYIANDGNYTLKQVAELVQGTLRQVHTIAETSMSAYDATITNSLTSKDISVTDTLDSVNATIVTLNSTNIAANDVKPRYLGVNIPQVGTPDSTYAIIPVALSLENNTSYNFVTTATFATSYGSNAMYKLYIAKDGDPVNYLIEAIMNSGTAPKYVVKDNNASSRFYTASTIIGVDVSLTYIPESAPLIADKVKLTNNSGARITVTGWVTKIK